MNSGHPRFLLYKHYESGYSNELMSMELAVGLAHATQRTLVLYGSGESSDGLRPIAGGHSWHVPEGHVGLVENKRVPTLLDLLEPLPVERIDYRVFLELARERAMSRLDCPLRLAESLFVDRLGPARDVQAFAGERHAFTNPPEDVFHLYRSNLSFASRLFYNPSEGVQEKIAAVRLREPYRSLAHEAARSVGAFNAVHVRLADFRRVMDVQRIFPRDADYARAIVDTLREHFSPEQPLLISTDEPWSRDILDPVRLAFPRHMLVDELLTGPFADQFRKLPFRDEITFAAIAQAIMCEAQDFVGTPRSTFSALIHRAVHARPELSSRPFKFTFSGFAEGTAAFDRGVYTECFDGPYSWNRLRMPISEGQKGWVREWPESIAPRRITDGSVVAPSDDPAAMINVALGRAARQSSLSRWSHAYEANRAVSGWRNGSFAFHTDFEDAPWWEVDLGRPYPLDRVVVYNRRNECFERARTLSIALRESAYGAAETVYAGRSSFAGMPAGAPLTIGLAGRRARFVRLQLHEHTALHLEQVEILVHPSDYAREIAPIGNP